MGFEDLEQKLEKFFQAESIPSDNLQKMRIKELVLAKFSAKKQSIWQKLGAFFVSKYALPAIGLILVIGFIPILNNQIYAGEISRKSGLVEIIRNGKRIILDGKSKIKVGDEIIVQENAEANLNLRNNFKSEIRENTRVKVDGRNSLFLIKGELNNNLEKGEITTNKGEILAKKPTKFLVNVNGSGETKIAPQKNSVSVRDWTGTEISLTAGEELRLRSDTKLHSQLLPKNLNLSNTQIKAIRSKLFITRTKAINYIEDKISRDFQKSEKDLASAEESFKSIAQILKTSRDLKTLLTKENIDMVSIGSIYDRVSKKTNNRILLSEIKAVEKLLKIIYQTKYFDLKLSKTGVISFDRYVLVSRLFAKNEPETKKLGDILREQYINSFVTDIMNEELKIDQISILNEKIKKIPRKTIAKFFLQEVSKKLPKDLSEMLLEKIENRF